MDAWYRDGRRSLIAHYSFPVTIVMPRLTEIKKGTECIFVRLHDGGRQRLQRLVDMGILPGEPLKVIDNQGHGPVMIYVKGARVALGHLIAAAIEVREIAYGKKEDRSDAGGKS
ncbi:MAG: ferrous iron transport protein A [Candidatus Omnitrophota bacterium]